MMMPVPVVGFFERKAPPRVSAPKAALRAGVPIEHPAPGRPARQATRGAVRSSPFALDLGLYGLKAALLSGGLVLLFVFSFLPSRQELGYVGTAVAPGLFCAAGLAGLLGGLLCLSGTGAARLWFVAAMALDVAQATLAALRWVPGIDVPAFENDLVAALAQHLPLGPFRAGASGLEMSLIATVAGVAGWGMLLVALWRFAEEEELPELADEAKSGLVRWLVQVGLTWSACLLIPILVVQLQLNEAVFGGTDLSVPFVFIGLLALVAMNAYLSYQLIEDRTAAALGSLSVAAFFAMACSPYPFLFATAALLLYQSSRATFDFLTLTGRLRRALASGARA
jgi:hypothetical protein